ncbi:MAG: bifunctional hydroxymethylpyrimidine kinase/phosphomethylpyrimidine kinase, partial [Planctomycetota bacterium]
MKKALTIAGSDSGGGAGIQADLKTFAAFGIFGTSAITAITAQNTLEVTSIHPVPPGVVKDQVDAVLSDIGADAVKTGMLFSAEIVTAVAQVLADHGPPHVVVDPVMISKSGAELLDAGARAVVKEELLPLCEVLTPNLPEAEALLNRPVKTVDEMREAAASLHRLGPPYVLVKGGHLEGEVVDILYDGRALHEFRSERIDTRHTHGTGCTLSSAIAACLALGMKVPEAVGTARDYVARAI